MESQDSTRNSNSADQTNEIGHTQHVSVMLDEVLEFLRPRAGGLYIDGTVGGGGHTAQLLAQSAPSGRVLGIDTDERALERVSGRLAGFITADRLKLVHGNFDEMRQLAVQAGFIGVQGILLDLGFSSDQMDDPQRGFAFSSDGPLDMRLDQSLAVSAADLVNTASEQELADIIWRYGEESRSRAIARRIVRERSTRAITRTSELAKIAAAGVPYTPGSIHPATKTFQALRIAVNHELERLETVLPQITELLSQTDLAGQAARVAIISFHSLEDRIVKEYFRREATGCLCPPRLPVCVCGHKARLRVVTSRPVTPTVQEIERNPRARSAKLRVAEKIIEA
ncbi:16S rRNA (cytosine(1402)-N(4))-methyltransferase RsmH [Tengunoibacter tsumagoiensis]|uniref:Ribosomal RNA small subunit methyltransferase H n=1 Tax=Tengunoibacter tsumagoiensis TaxID=2014871 RepID=A0A402A5J1_9CHLR|nr:16S rRNA (cytosine(1402)-N(4))-methyltransferase RsmH [Tengunoibacter tsumagoiensis]GCE14408.1 ribosomal RNA small subunit methyltransferase H [Tengunoibacter tsumagoiensis]